MVKHSKREGGQRRAINTKITDNIRARLEASAAENERTMSAEVEWRLIRSFLDDKLSEYDEEMDRDQDTRELVEKIRAIVGSIFRFTGKSWKHDQPSRDAVACGVGVALQLLFDNDPIDLPAEGSEERKQLERQRVVLRAQGRTMALGILAPDLKDQRFEEFVSDLRVQSGYSSPAAVTDYEELRRQFEILSDPKD